MIMSSAVATVVSRQIIGDNQFFLAINAPWQANAIPCYFLCGIFCALVGVYVIKAAYFTSAQLKSRFRNPWLRLFAGGSVLCVILLVFPLLRGQGYLYIEKLFTGDMEGLVASAPLLGWIPSQPALLVILVVVVILVKVIASVLTVDSGGDGGIFAPSMFIGAFAGFAFARLVNLTGVIQLQEYNFVAVGMCGVFTAVMRAPLTGIFLIAEVTGGYILLVRRCHGSWRASSSRTPSTGRRWWRTTCSTMTVTAPCCAACRFGCCCRAIITCSSSTIRCRR